MVSPWIRIGDLLNRSPSLSPKKRWVVWEEDRQEMSYEGTPVKALRATRRRMMPLAPVD